MSLAAKCGETIIVRAEGRDEDKALEAVKQAIETNL